MKQRIRLSESDLHKMIKESVRQVLREDEDYEGKCWDLMGELMERIGSDSLCSLLMNRLAGQIDYRGVYETLQDIYAIELNGIEDEDDDF